MRTSVASLSLGQSSGQCCWSIRELGAVKAELV